MSNFIYVLADPLVGIPRYIGKTNDLPGRLKDHLSEAKRGVRTWRCNWIRSLLADELLPVQRILEVLPDEADWSGREQYWIRYFKKRGYKLVNGTEGGEGGIVTRLSGVFKHSKETCEKMRRDRLGLRHSVSWCKNISEGQKRSEKTKAHLVKMSEGNRGVPRSEEVKRKLSVARKGKPLSLDHRAKLSGVHRGKSPSLETRCKMSLSKIGNTYRKDFTNKIYLDTSSLTC